MGVQRRKPLAKNGASNSNSARPEGVAVGKPRDLVPPFFIKTVLSFDVVDSAGNTHTHFWSRDDAEKQKCWLNKQYSSKPKSPRKVKP